MVESKVPVLVLSFRNCELICCHLDGYGKERGLFLKRLSDVSAWFSSSVTRRIWFNIDDTELDADLIEQTVQSILAFKCSIVKIAFIGSGRYRRHLDNAVARALKTHNKKLNYAFFDDAELAKEWLV